MANDKIGNQPIPHSFILCIDICIKHTTLSSQTWEMSKALERICRESLSTVFFTWVHMDLNKSYKTNENKKA